MIENPKSVNLSNAKATVLKTFLIHICIELVQYNGFVRIFQHRLNVMFITFFITLKQRAPVFHKMHCFCVALLLSNVLTRLLTSFNFFLYFVSTHNVQDDHIEKIHVVLNVFTAHD